MTEPVGVHVHEPYRFPAGALPRPVLAGDHECRRGDPPLHPETCGDTPGQRSLSGAEGSVEHHQVARLQVRGEPAASASVSSTVGSSAYCSPA